MTEIHLLVVPYELGALRRGVGRGPDRLLEFGAEDALRGRGARVRTEVVQLDEDLRDRSGDSEVNAAFSLIRQLSDRVRETRAEGAFPLLLSGSCFNAVGMVAGMGESSPGVVWFDAHGDFNEPETATDGYIDGMGLAVLTGGAWQAMNDAATGGSIVPESAVVLAGARAFDPPEEVRLRSSRINHLTPGAIDSDDAVSRATSSLDPEASGLYVHVDLDVLDSDEARVNVYSAPDGLSSSQLETQVRSLLESHPVRALSLTAYDPECDPDGRVPPIAMRLLETVAESLEH